jgi:SAM-dependent methyltransferase
MNRLTDETSYDRVLYSGHPFSDTHPDHLGTIASLYGAAPALATRCRVLELGCGDGGNLVPMAYELPDSEFVGIDLSRRAVEAGQTMIAELRLANVKLQHRDIMTLSAEDGRFDYIIAHGVYSWVPQQVRCKILTVLRQNLTPQGVAYVSYNALPGAHMRNLARSIMLFHVRDVEDPDERVRQSRGLLELLAQASAQDQVYGVVLRDQLERIKSTPDAVLLHDDLDAGSTPFFLHQVVEAAAQEGLRYVADADFDHANKSRYSEQGLRFVSRIPEDEAAVRDQYLDFLDGRAFHKSLFCHHEVPLQPRLTPQCVRNYHLAAVVTESSEADLTAPGVVRFNTPSGGKLATDHRLSKIAISLLGKAWPRAVAFPDLIDQALSHTSQSDGGGTHEAEIDALSNVLFQAFCAGLIHLHRSPRRLTTVVSEKPRASELARWQVTRRALVTNLLHGSVQLDDPIARAFLPLVDGTRTVEQLLSDLRATLARQSPPGSAVPVGDGRQEVTAEAVASSLNLLAKLGLLLD